jgi:hypothetical protein
MKWPWTRPEPTNTHVIERLEAVERKLKALQTDWDETYEKFQRLNARLAQRWKRLVAAEDDGGGVRETPPGGSGPGAAGNDAAPELGITNPLALELLRGKAK